MQTLETQVAEAERVTHQWMQSRNGDVIHFCACRKEGHKYMPKPLCGCKPSERGWRVKPSSTVKCEECEWRLNLVLDALAEMQAKPA